MKTDAHTDGSSVIPNNMKHIIHVPSSHHTQTFANFSYFKSQPNREVGLQSTRGFLNVVDTSLSLTAHCRCCNLTDPTLSNAPFCFMEKKLGVLSLQPPCTTRGVYPFLPISAKHLHILLCVFCAPKILWDPLCW